jgi:hypothetical protein
VLCLTVVALALAGCADDTPDIVPLNEANACKAVREKLDAKELEGRFGKPDAEQDFFGDRVFAYETDDGERWQFQVSAQAGTFRALRVEGKREKIVDCPR